MKVQKVLAAFLMVAFLICGSQACAVAASVMEKGVVVMGTEGTYPPFEYYDQNNQLTGYDIEIARAICKRMGKELKIVDMAFDGLIPALLTGKIDMIAAGIANTQERKKKVDFSDIYNVSYTSFIVKHDNNDIKGLGDLKGKKVGVQIGSTQDLYISKLDTPMEIRRYQKNDDAIREVVLGRNESVAINSFVGNSYIDNEKFKDYLKVAFRVMVNRPDEGIAIAVRKNDPEFLNAVNEALRGMVESGELKQLKQKYRLD